MNTCLEMRAYIDISRWWPKDSETGSPRSVYAVHKEIEEKAKDNLVTRHTLTRARDGQLQNADIDNQVKLARLCSMWSGKEITVNEIIQVVEDRFSSEAAS